MSDSRSGVAQIIDARPLERHEWTLLPLALIAYGTAALALLAFAAQVVTLPSSIGSTGPVTLTLHTSFQLPAAAGTHQYFGGAYIADDAVVTATGARAEVSGVAALTRVLLPLVPLLWSATTCATAAAVGLTLARLRRRDGDRSASRPLLVAAVALALGSTAAQVVSAIAFTQVGHVSWAGRIGTEGFTASPDTVFDATPLVIAVALLSVVLIIRRSEPTPAPRPDRASERSVAVAADRAEAEGSGGR